MRHHPCLALAVILAFGLAAPMTAQEEEVEEDSVEEPAASTDTAVESDETEEEEEEEAMSASTFAGLKLRCLGPAVSAGRIGDFAVNPDNHAQYFIAVASGGVWKTANGGTTWQPVFDGEGSYSIGCVEMDPHNPSVVWVGTGENNSQRSVGFGDGVYKSVDGGASWKNVGLKESEHIGMITIDPRDSDVVYVAAQGPLWRAGGDRGLYKTTDGSETWECILSISEDTGVNEVHLDPRDPDVLYATAYQRRRHVWSLIDGGPESGLHKSTDGGATWRKITQGLPSGDLGRIGLDIAPANPDVVYAIVEAAEGESGFFRSTDRGETWEKRSDYQTTSAQYYNEIFCDPHDADRVYVLDTILKVTEDGGKTFQRMPRRNRHVDDHAFWIDPDNADHLLVGCDGGVYETHDRGENWHFKPNLPVTQFYRVTADNSSPFYHVYGGTQDNQTLGGPSRTTNPGGIFNEHWLITVGGDGFKTQIDPVDPNIVYSQLQHGNLVRYDRHSGERVAIKPREAPGEEPLRWNWDSPLIISPHDPHRLYFAANILFRSDDRGDSWRAVSGDLTRQLNRDQMEMMGKVWRADAVSKHHATSAYGNCVSLAESPLVEGLIYIGTDDGLVQVTEDGGETWRKVETFADVPELTYVSGLIASQHDPDAVYATFDNHKMGDFAPYVLRSTDRGQTWGSISGDLPERNVVYAIAEDHVKPGLLFVGTEFGAYFTVDGGEKWMRLKGGLPTIAVRDIDIQERESDLVLATFGRGIYVLDDYSPLRIVSEELLEEDTVLFAVKDALRYIETSRLGGSSGKGSQGASFYAAANPPFGAVFTYYLKEKLLSRKERRHKAEKEAEKAGEAPPYPTLEELRAEDEERAPRVILTVRDEEGAVVARITGARGKGLHRVAWNLRYPAATPPSIGASDDRSLSGPLAIPGMYSVTVSKEEDGVLTELAGPAAFQVVPLELATFAARDREAVLGFQRKVARLRLAIRGALGAAAEAKARTAHLREAFFATPKADPALLAELRDIEERLNNLLVKLRGNRSAGRRELPSPMSVQSRLERVVGNQWHVTSPPTQTQRDAYRYAGEEFTGLLAELREIVEQELVRVEKVLEEAGAPWTPGRIPEWSME